MLPLLQYQDVVLSMYLTLIFSGDLSLTPGARIESKLRDIATLMRLLG
jgi:hypothetical protein